MPSPLIIYSLSNRENGKKGCRVIILVLHIVTQRQYFRLDYEESAMPLMRWREQRPKWSEGPPMQLSKRRALQGEGLAGEKALRWACLVWWGNSKDEQGAGAEVARSPTMWGLVGSGKNLGIFTVNIIRKLSATK